jgi:hypothetical protein
MTKNENVLVSNIENFVADVVKKYPGVTFETSIEEGSYGYDVLLISLNSDQKIIRYDIVVNLYDDLYDPESYDGSDKLVQFDSLLRRHIKDEIEALLQ